MPTDTCCASEDLGRAVDRMARIEKGPNVSQLLSIAQRVEQFVNDNGWSWCTMDQVYKILKSAHQ